MDLETRARVIRATEEKLLATGADLMRLVWNLAIITTRPADLSAAIERAEREGLAMQLAIEKHADGLVGARLRVIDPQSGATLVDIIQIAPTKIAASMAA
jgi:hypothetical protein